MLQIERIEQEKTSGYEVELSDGTRWHLYKSDIKRYGLEVGKELSEAEQAEIHRVCVTVRARKKVLAMLERMDRTEQDLRHRLARAGYPEEAVDEAIAYAKKFGYINDERYARSYARSRSRTKSRRQIEAELYQKGITGKKTEELFEDALPEEEAIRKLIRRKTTDIESLEPAKRQKLALSLYRKGFPQDLIRRELKL